jgi:uncharacterized protein
MRARRKLLLRAVTVAGCLYALLSIAGAIAFVEFSLRPPKRLITQQQIVVALEHAARLEVRADQVEITSSDALRLRGWYVTPKTPNGSVVMLFHGVADNRLGVGGFAELFVRHGYSVLLADSRTHGESDGKLATYGIREARDVHDWMEWIYRAHQPSCVYGFGESMGAGIVLQSLAEEVRFCAVVAESPFADFREAVYDRIGGALQQGPWLAKTLLRPTVELGFVYARLRYGLDFTARSPRSAVAHSRVPVLVIHGERDSVLLLCNSESIKAANPTTVLWAVPDAEHCGAWSAQPKLFEQRVLEWFSAHHS